MLAVWILLIFLASLLLLLAVPLELSFRARLEQGQRTGDGQVRWLFGLVRLRLPFKAKAGKKNQVGKPKRRRHRKRRQSPLAVLSVEGIVTHVLIFVRRLLRAVRIRRLTVEAHLGLDDPADTGRLWAVVGPVGGMLASTGPAALNLQPDFDGEVLTVNSEGRIQLVPLQLVALAVIFFLSPKTLRAMRAMRS